MLIFDKNQKQRLCEDSLFCIYSEIFVFCKHINLHSVYHLLKRFKLHYLLASVKLPNCKY